MTNVYDTTSNNNPNEILNENIDAPSIKESSGNTLINETVSGTGDNQTVRTYFINQSLAENNMGYFNITVPNSEMNFSQGDFNFTFNNNYTTNHVIEDDNALTSLNENNLITHEYDPSNSWLTLSEGADNMNGDFLSISDNNDSTYWNLTSTSGTLNFTINANFTDVLSSDVETIFNRSNVLGFLLSLRFNITLDANLTIKAWNNSIGEWVDISNTIPINASSSQPLQIDRRFINKNLFFINSSNITKVQFYFNKTDYSSNFNVILIEFDLKSALAFDVPITSEKYVALEFDLRGEGTKINGFFAWIRTINQMLADGGRLNVSLYRANDSIVRKETELQKNSIKPDDGSYIGSTLIYSFKGDDVYYVNFSSINATNLGIGNYFIVIKSNLASPVYRLITIPCSKYGDLKTEHQLKISTDSGATWTNAKKTIQTTNTPYTSKQLDASSFKLNVTRGYLPSDFNGTLRIENLTIVDKRIDVYPYKGSSVEIMEWGKGRWNRELTTPISADKFNHLFINLTGYHALTKDLSFNVTYLAEIYQNENVTSIFHVNYNGVPLWTLNGTLDPNQYLNWNFTEYWFIYPNFWDTRNLTTPNPENGDALGSIEAPTPFSEDSRFEKLILTTSIVNVSNPLYNGSYVLNLTSYNCINQMHSFLNFDGILWETEGFMIGDNISVSVYIQDEFGIAPSSGSANATLFFPNNSRVPSASLYSKEGALLSQLSLLKYDFSNQTLINILPSLPEVGRYQIGFFWTNGSAIGCRKMYIYIDNYDIELSGANYYPEIGVNVLEGRFVKKILNTYSILMASVNETTGTWIPNYFSISNESLNKIFTYQFGAYLFNVSLKAFRQNETILNPNEEISFKITLENQDDNTDLNVRIKVQLLSLVNEKWIVAEKDSNTIKLKYNGHPQDSTTFNLTIAMPSYNELMNRWNGVNSPVRLGGVKTRVQVYVENSNVGHFDYPEYSLLTNVNDTEFEGEIITTKTSFNISSNTITKVFERDECLYSPQLTYFIVNIFDENYISSLISPNFSKTFKSDSKFEDITYSPSNPIKGNVLTLSATLKTEFDEIMANKRVTCEYFDGNSWINITSEKTDSAGVVSFTIETLPLTIQENFGFRLKWLGDANFLSKTQEIPINITSQFNQISLHFNTQENQAFFRSQNNTLTITISNTGNSTIRILDMNIEFDLNINYTIIEKNVYELNRLESGHSTSLTLEFTIPDIEPDLLNVTISVRGQNVLSNEIVRAEAETSLTLLDPSLPTFIIGISALIAIGGIWIFSIWYSRKLIVKIETPKEEIPKKKKKIKKGKYVKVSELSQESTKPSEKAPEESKKEVPSKEKTTEKKQPKKKGKKEKSGKKNDKKVDLDDLIKREGLED